MTPKSLLRNPRAAASLAELAQGHFRPVLGDPDAAQHPERVARLALCSGKVAVDLVAARPPLLVPPTRGDDRGVGAAHAAHAPPVAAVQRSAIPAAQGGAGQAKVPVAIARVEQLYPFPADDLRGAIARYPNLREIVWVQEEPRNMGAWYYVEPRLLPLVPPNVTLGYIGRPERAATAEGYPEVHAAEQARIVAAALTPEAGERGANIETRGTADVR
jgi:2-oxoglutarate dehydrogenase E1 component